MKPPARGLNLLVIVVTSVLLPSCKGDSPNPFADLTPTVAPRPDAEILFTANIHGTRSGAPRELFAVAGDGSGLTRLTHRNDGARPHDVVEAAPAPDRIKVAVREVTDSSGDNRIGPGDDESIVLLDLARSVEAELVAASRRPSSVDWSSDGSLLIYSGLGAGSIEDMLIVDPTGKDEQALTTTPLVRERRPRLAVGGGAAIYERIEAGGKGVIAVYRGATQFALTTGGPGTEQLPGTPYVLGSDADPVFSPDVRLATFRRLTGTGNGGLGTWDLLTVRPDGTSPTIVATGPLYRGAPDWGPRGIVFTEADSAQGVTRLVVVQPDGSERKVLVTASSNLTITNPRWLPQP